MEERTETWIDIFCKIKAEIANHPIKFTVEFISIISIDLGGGKIGELIGENVGFRRTGAMIGVLIGAYSAHIMTKKIANLGEKIENYILNFFL